MFNNPIVVNTLIAGILASLSFGPIGSLIVTKRISYIVGAIAHTALGGIGIGIYLNLVHGISWIGPYVGGMLFATVAAILIGIIRSKFKEREDTLLGAFWSIGMATGLIFLSKCPSSVDPLDYLFGNILLINTADLYALLALGVFIAITFTVFYNRIVAISFDSEFSKIRGIHPNLFYIAMLILSSIAIVLLIKIVGIILVMALFTIAPAITSGIAKRLGEMMIGSAVLCAIFSSIGTMISYQYDLPTGPSIILIASLCYILKLFFTFKL